MRSKLNVYLVRSALGAALGGLLFGFDTGAVAGALRALTALYALSPGMLGITVASALGGTILGSLLAAAPSDRYGRIACLRALAILYGVSATGCALSWSWPALIFFRVIAGLAMGGLSVISPVYIAEIAPADRRGRLVGLFECNIGFGILFAYLSNYLIGLTGLGGHEWRWKMGAAALPALAFFFALSGLPQSPRWLVRARRFEDAREVLTRLGEAHVDRELGDISETLRLQPGRGKEPLFQRKYRIPILLAVSIGIFNQLSGINAVLYYANRIFEYAGFSQVSGDMQAIAIGSANLLFTVLGMAAIDRLGRRKLLLGGAAATAVCLAGVAGILATHRHPNLLVWLLLAFVASFAFSQGAVIWVYLSEVFPNLVRAKGQSLGSFTHWTVNALVSATFPLMAASSAAVPFTFFAFMAVVQFFVVLRVYPETKGVTLEELEHRLKSGRQSPGG